MQFWNNLNFLTLSPTCFAPNHRDVFILAGGLGTRFKSSNVLEKKPFAPLHGRPLLYWIVRGLVGISFIGKIHILLREKDTAEHLSAITVANVFSGHVTVAYQPRSQNIVQSIYTLSSTEKIIVVNGDTITDFNAINSFEKYDNVLLVSRVDTDIIGGRGIVELKDSTVNKIARTNGLHKGKFYSPTGQYQLRREHLPQAFALPHCDSVDKYLSYLATAIKGSVKCLKTEADVYDIGTKQSYHTSRIKAVSLLDSYRVGFLDRDGTLNKDLGHKTALLPIELLHKSLENIRSKHYNLHIVVSNQSAVARGIITIKQLELYTLNLHNLLLMYNIKVLNWNYCPHHPIYAHNPQACFCRKPNNLMISNALHTYSILSRNATMHGDSESDMIAAHSLSIPFERVHHDSDL